MENSIYIGLFRQMVLTRQMDLIANNVANAGTAGFRAQNLSFKEMISKPSGEKEPLSFVAQNIQYQNVEAGPVKFTGNPLDIMLEGPGFIGVAADGGLSYTRAGNFQLSASGQLLTSAGDPVASNGGSAITIPADSTEIKIDEKGVISNQDGQVGQIMIAEFKDPKNMLPLGNNLYRTSETPGLGNNTRVKQGQVEGSNVQAVLEMNRMVQTLRDFQNVQNILQTENERMRTVIQRLTRQA